jgi:predicted ATPase
MSIENFDIGEKLQIELCAGEAYQVVIESGGIRIPLADKGMGSIQAMLLILRLACIIHQTKTNSIKPTVLIEEPELNLHPALQSKLAELFLDVIKYGIKLIVETHSEYLIRKTQLLVKENEFEVKPNENPFCVLYFDKEKQWKMNYREDGKFIDEFGKGFYDESALLTLSLL